MVGLPQYSECLEAFYCKTLFRIFKSLLFMMGTFYYLEEGEIPPWQNTLNSALERPKQLKAALHIER